MATLKERLKQRLQVTEKASAQQNLSTTTPDAKPAPASTSSNKRARSQPSHKEQADNAPGKTAQAASDKRPPKRQKQKPKPAVVDEKEHEEDDEAKQEDGDRLGGMRDKLRGAQFRWLNEQLYTSSSDSAWKMMQDDPSQFEAYHEGFRTQVKKWPVNPVDSFVDYLKKNPTFVAGDFGCGDAKIAQSVPNKVYSFDLVSNNELVTACDIRKVPLPDESLDVAIFCLSLMGVNYLDFLKEAHRTLKYRGLLKIVEVESRFEGLGFAAFAKAVEAIGFSLVQQRPFAKMFVAFDFMRKDPKASANAVDAPLKPCRYKKR